MERESESMFAVLSREREAATRTQNHSLPHFKYGSRLLLFCMAE